MIWNRKKNGPADDPVDIEALDPVLKQALGEFKSSVRAWSDAAYSRPRAVRAMVVRKRKMAVGWSLAALLLAGALSGGLYQRHHQQEVAAQLEAQHAAEARRQADAQQQARNAETDEEVLASVDKDLSREVPTAMEPLAQLGDEGEAQ